MTQSNQRKGSCTYCGKVAAVRSIGLGNVTEWLRLPDGWLTLVDAGEIIAHVCSEEHARKYSRYTALLVERATTTVRFRCPECGGSSFGSSGPPHSLHRFCHGDDAGDGAHDCKFNWPERDDPKYFHEAR